MPIQSNREYSDYSLIASSLSNQHTYTYYQNSVVVCVCVLVHNELFYRLVYSTGSDIQTMYVPVALPRPAL